MAKKRKVPALNSSSMADVSFILLIFFLVTTSMDSNKGLQRRLPQPLPPDQKAEDIDIKKRNIFVVKVNSMNQLLVQGEIMNDVSQLKEKAKEFIKNEANDPDLPEKSIQYIDYLGEVETTKAHVISLQNDVDTQYQTYIEVQNELVKAVNELRDEFAKAHFGRAYLSLSEDQQRIAREAIPQNISEAEPKDVSKN